MSLTLDGSPVLVTGIKAACSRPSATEIVCAVNVGGTYKIRRYDATVGAGHVQNGSDIALSAGHSPDNVAMISNNLVAAVSSTTANVDIVDLTGPTVSPFTLTAATFVRSQQQLAAGSTAAGMGYSVAGTSSTAVNQFNATGPAAAQITLNFSLFTGEYITCIIAGPGTTFICGTSQGRIVNVDSNFNMLSQYALPDDKYVMPRSTYSPFQIGIAQLAYYSGMLLAETEHSDFFLFDHDAQELIYRESGNGTENSDFIGVPFVLSSPNNHTVIAATGTYGFIFQQARMLEFDFCSTPFTYGNPVGVGGGVPFTNCGAIGNSVWGVTLGQTIYWWSQTLDRTTTLKTLTFTGPGSWMGKGGDIICLDDGKATPKLMIQVKMPTSNTKTVPLTAGTNVLIAAASPSIQAGTPTLSQINRIDT